MNLDLRSRHWIILGLGAVAVALYLGLLRSARVESVLEQLADQSQTTAALFAQDGGRGEALVIVFGFLLLTPVAFAMIAFVPLFTSGIVAEFLFSVARVPHAVGSVAFFIVITLLAWLKVEAWLPSIQWLGSLIARAFLIALRSH